MGRLCVEVARAEALFVTNLQPSERNSAERIRMAVTVAVRAHGTRGCAAMVAAHFGEQPETAVARMRWARAAVREAFPSSSRAVRAALHGGRRPSAA